jgi:hypothetical protein
MSVKSSLALEKPAAQIKDSPSLSVGLATAKLLDIKSEMEQIWQASPSAGLIQQ